MYGFINHEYDSEKILRGIRACCLDYNGRSFGRVRALAITF